MYRYCVNCKKEFDFPVSDFTGDKELICPECGGVIDRSSRLRADIEGTERTEAFIGRVISKVLRFMYVFYMSLAVVGIVAFFLRLDTVLYVTAGISAAVYILQLATRTATFRSGMIFVPAGAIAGYLLLGGLRGACLGVHLVFLVRHAIRDVLYRLFVRLMSLIERAGQ